MGQLPDRILGRLREAVDRPDLTGTRYRLLSPIGHGGMGAVYLAEDTTLGRQVALKVLHPEIGSAEAAARLLREARTLAVLEHPGIVPVHDAGVLADGRAFYVMKWVRGRRLDEYCRSASLSEKLLVFVRICEAAAFAHAQGVIHRDLKPQNVMVGSFGEVLVLDWGIAKWLHRPEADVTVNSDRDGATGHGAVLGTPSYMPPEQAHGSIDSVDARSDVYALGAILRDLAGEKPAKSLTAIIRKAMADDMDLRYGSAELLSADVIRCLEGLPVSAHRENLFERAARLFVRHRTAILLVAAYLFMRFLLIFFRSR